MSMLSMVRVDPPASPPAIALYAAGATDIGRTRRTNEDALWLDLGLAAFLVCDGIGGHVDGEVAAQLAELTISSALAESAPLLDRARAGRVPPAEIVDLCMRAFVRANDAIRETTAARGFAASESPMGTTATLLVQAGPSRMVMCHIGDSRLYLIRAGEVHQLSTDHTLVNLLLQHQQLSPEEVESFPFGNALERGLGLGPVAVPETLVFDVAAGDRLLLATDGLDDGLSDLGTLLYLETDVDDAVRHLMRLADESGGRDNATAIVVDVDVNPHDVENRDTGDGDRVFKIELLRLTWLGAGLKMRQLQRLANIAGLVRVDSGISPVEQWAPGSGWFQLVEGRMSVTSATGVEWMDEGSSAGTGFLAAERPSNATFTARGPVTLLVVSADRFRRLCEEKPRLGVELLGRVAAQLDRENQRQRFKQRQPGDGV